MKLLEVLPDRPLQRSEVDSLDDSDRIVGNFPVYLEQASDFAIGLVVATGGTAYALSYSVDTEGWELVAQRDLKHHDVGGVHVDDMESIKELQSTASQHAGASE